MIVISRINNTTEHSDGDGDGVRHHYWSLFHGGVRNFLVPPLVLRLVLTRRSVQFEFDVYVLYNEIPWMIHEVGKSIFKLSVFILRLKMKYIYCIRTKKKKKKKKEVNKENRDESKRSIDRCKSVNNYIKNEEREKGKEMNDHDMYDSMATQKRNEKRKRNEKKKSYTL
jgi:hypothetical protein